VGEDKVRGWIRRGELAAVNTAAPGERPRYVVTPEALASFEMARRAGPAPKALRKKRPPQTTTDFYP
jgi:hypothetical protein